MPSEQNLGHADRLLGESAIPEAPQPTSPGGATPRESWRDHPARTGLRILVVDDHFINRQIAVHLLNRMGHSCVTAASGPEALVALDGLEFDAVLMDIQMPEMDGFQVTVAIRERERSQGGRLPIIAVTALGAEGGRRQFLESGMDGYVPKPVSSRQLLAAIEEAIGSCVGRCCRMGGRARVD